MKRLHTISLLVAVLLSSYSLAQTTQCNFVDTPPQNEEERQRRARFEVYRRILSYYTTLLPNQPDTALLMPVEGIKLSQIADTWGAPRGSGRSHEGQDIFAPLGTPI